MTKRRNEAMPAESDVESVCDKFEGAWKRGDYPLIEDYLQQKSASERGELLVELLQVELWRRRAETPPPSLESLQDRFPDFADDVEATFIKFHERIGIAETTRPRQSPDLTPRDSGEHAADDFATMVPASDGWGSTAGIAQPKKIGRYTIVRRLGRGGQGAVYRAVHPNLPIELAIKISAKPLDADCQQSLRDETQILCDLDHPNIGRVRDLDFFEGRPFVVLDFIRGRSLRDRLGTAEVSQQQAVNWLATVARAIDFAHRRGTVHLDLKPDNIVIDENNEPKVIDFGMARMRDAWSDSATEEDLVSGTFQYMPPEQATGQAKRIGSHCDVFALGAILYRILVGKPPFAAGDVRTMLKAIRRGDFDRQSLESVEADPILVTACLKAMSIEPPERFASAAEFADAIVPPPAPKGKSAALSVRILGMSVTLAVTMSIALMMILRPESTGPHPGPTMVPTQGGVSGVPESSIAQLAVTHIGNEQDSATFSAPLFVGRAAREQDDVRIDAQFSRPVYCFLYALNPDGALQLCYPGSELDVQSETISQLKYPSGEGMAFGLTDGAGYQAFVLVTSLEPLPAFADWKETQPNNPWPDETITGNWVYSRGDLVPRRFGVGQTRGHVRPMKEPAAFKQYLESISTDENIDVECVLFEVGIANASEP